MNVVLPNRLENLDIVRRAVREVLPGDVVALDSGLPELAPGDSAGGVGSVVPAARRYVWSRGPGTGCR